jgi:copper chaperone CopZ
MKTSTERMLTLQVERLGCTECAVAVEKALARRAGVEDVKILSAAEPAISPRWTGSR